MRDPKLTNHPVNTASDAGSDPLGRKILEQFEKGMLEMERRRHLTTGQQLFAYLMSGLLWCLDEDGKFVAAADPRETALASDSMPGHEDQGTPPHGHKY